MDPRSQIQVWELVRLIAAAGTTVLLTTQYLEEADQPSLHEAFLALTGHPAGPAATDHEDTTS
jgi:ABC-type multidrug transport system ATPase subunit